MINKHIHKAERQLQLAHRMIHSEPDTVQKFAVLSIAESLLAIAKSMTDTAEEPDYPEILGLKLKGITPKVEWTPEQYAAHWQKLQERREMKK